MHTLHVLAIGTALMTATGSAQVPFTGADITIDFDSTVAGVNAGQFTGTGFQPGPINGQLDSDAWAVSGLSEGGLGFGGTQTGPGGDFARGISAGGETTGGIYAFQVGGASDVGLGLQPGGTDFTPGTITLRIQNNTGSVLDQLAVSYEIHVRNDEGRSSSLNFSYSTDGAVFSPLAALDYTSVEGADPTPAWIQVDRGTTLLSLAILAGAHLDLRWTTDDVGGTGFRDEFAIDDIQIGVPVPEPSDAALAVALLLAGGGVVRRLKRRAGRSG